MITADKVTEIFCIIDEFSRNLDEELRKNLSLPTPDPSGIACATARASSPRAR